MNKHGRWRRGLSAARGLGMAAALLALSGAALAQNFGRAAVWHHTASGLVQEIVSTGRAHAASTDSAFNGTDTQWSFIASAFADIDRGAVGASVIAEKSGPSGFFPLTVNTLSTVLEMLTFHGPRPAEVEFTATITGSFAAAVESSSFLASSWLHFGGSDSTAEFRYTHRPLSPDREAQVQTNGTVSAVVDEISGLSATLHVRRLVNPGDVLPLQAEFALRVTPANDDIAVANFGHTVQLGYVLPPGFSFTSSSGTFMTLPPLPAVPEPATGVMAAAGLLVLLAARARRRQAAGLAAVLLMATPGWVTAQAFAQVSREPSGWERHDRVASGRAGVEGSDVLNVGGEQLWSFVAGAHASMAGGTLGTDLAADTGRASGPYALLVRGTAEVGDTMTFNGPTAGEVEFRLSLTGAFGSFDGGVFHAAATLAVEGADTAWAEFGYTHRALSGDRQASTSNQGAVDVLNRDIGHLSSVVRVRRWVEPGDSLLVRANLFVAMRPGLYDHATANFGHTAQLDLRMPDGFSYTSDSGTFMTQLPPPVPEPAPWQLALIGWPLLRRWLAYRRA